MSLQKRSLCQCSLLTSHSQAEQEGPQVLSSPYRQVDLFSHRINFMVSRVLPKITNHPSPHHKAVTVPYP